jgi:hypothetical protein
LAVVNTYAILYPMLAGSSTSSNSGSW